MNQIFKVIWSRVKHCYVVVSEIARSTSKTKSIHLGAGKASAIAAVMMLLSGSASAYYYNSSYLWGIGSDGKELWRITNQDHTGDPNGYIFVWNGSDYYPGLTWNGSRFVPIKVGFANGGVHFYSVNTATVNSTASGSNYNNEGATGNMAIAAGVGASAKGNHSVDIGTSASVAARSGYAVAIGWHASATGGAPQGAYGDYASYSVAIGEGATANGDSANALGESATAAADYAMALGKESYAGSKSSIALGESSVVTENGGRTRKATWKNVQATSYTGDPDIVPTFNGTVQGTAGTTTAGATAAVSEKAISSTTDGVNGAQNTVTYSYNTNVAQSGGALSIGNGDMGGNRRIQNVAAGLTAATSTDAVNGAQLYAVMTKPMTVTGNENQGTGTGNGSDQILGSKLTIAAAGTERTSGDYSGQNIKTTVSDGSVSLAMAKSPEFTKVTTGNTSMSSTGLQVGITGPSVTTSGIAAGNRQITSVASGGIVNSNAANIGDVKSYAKWTVKDNQSGNKVIDSSTPLTVTGDDYITTTVSDSGLALRVNENKLNTTITNNSTVQQNKTDITTINSTIAKGTKYVGDDGTGITKQLGETLDIVGGADSAKLTDGNIGVNNVSGKLKIQLAQNVNLGSNGTLTAGSAVIGKSEDGKSYVTGLDNKEWTVGQTQAVSGRAATEDQLKQVSDAIGTTVNEKAKWTIQDNQSGSKVIDSATPLVVAGDEYVSAKVDDTGLKVGVDSDKLGKNINIAGNGSITNINNTIAREQSTSGMMGQQLPNNLEKRWMF